MHTAIWGSYFLLGPKNLPHNNFERRQAFKEKTAALIIGGKHTGITGVIQKIIPEHKMIELKTKDEMLNVLIKQIMVTE